MISDNSFNMINLDADKLCVGLKQTLKALYAGNAVKVFLAEDCEDFIRESVKQAHSESGAELIKVPSMRTLGKMCGIDVKASCAAVLRS